MAQPEIPSGSDIQTNGLHGRDQTQCIKDTLLLENSSRLSLEGKEIEEVCDGAQTHCNPSAKSWIIQIKKKLDSRDKMWQVSKKVCIYRTPMPILISNPQAYVPSVVPFGPYHHKVSSELSRMDEYKLEAIIRTSTRLQININTLTEEVHELESEVREFYAEPIDLDGEALSLILTLDACFILEFFRLRRKRDHFSLIFPKWGSENSASITILDDIVKLENQIPLFVLLKILELEYGTHGQAIAELANMLHIHTMFSGFPVPDSRDDDAALSELKKYLKEKHPRHLLDLYRMVIVDLVSYSGTDHVERDPCSCAIDIKFNCAGWHGQLKKGCGTRSVDHSRSTPSAELLHKSGIKFKPGKFRFENKSFRSSTLFIPEISVEDRTERLLRNLMAYEECRLCSQPPEKNIISHYVRVLDDLIDSEKDVSLLRKSLIIKSYVGSDEEIARMFNRLSDGITFGKVDVFDKVMKEARDHYRSQWTVWISEFKQQHCSKPWYVISLVAAILILAMTAVQTVFSVKK